MNTLKKSTDGAKFKQMEADRRHTAPPCQPRFSALLLLLLFVFVIAEPSAADTHVNVVVSAQNFGMSNIGTTNTTLTPIGPLRRTDGTNLVVLQPVHQLTTNGVTVYTNVLWGTYDLTIDGAPPTTFRLNVGTNYSGSVLASVCVTPPGIYPPNPATNYYTEAQIDAIIGGLSFSGGGISVAAGALVTGATNGSLVTISGVSQTNGFGNVVYSNASAFDLSGAALTATNQLYGTLLGAISYATNHLNASAIVSGTVPEANSAHTITNLGLLGTTRFWSYNMGASVIATNVQLNGTLEFNADDYSWVVPTFITSTGVVSSFIGSGRYETNIPVTALNGASGTGSAATNGVLGQVAISAGNGGIFWSNFVSGGGSGTVSNNTSGTWTTGQTFTGNGGLGLMQTNRVSITTIDTTGTASNSVAASNGGISFATTGQLGLWGTVVANNAVSFQGAETNTTITGGVVAADANGKRKTALLSGLTWDGTTLTAGGGGSATNAVATVSVTNTAAATSTTNLDFWFGPNILIYATNRSGHADVTISSSYQTNIPVAAVTNSGTAAYSNASAFVLASQSAIQGYFPSAIHTNNMSIAASFSNNVSIDAAHILSLSNVTTGRLLTYTTAQGVTNIGVSSGIVDATGAQATSTQVQNLFPGAIVTNNESVAITFSNNIALDGAHFIYSTNLTSGRLAMYTTAGGFTNAGGSGAFSVNADGSLTTFPQIQGLAPGTIFTNNASTAASFSNNVSVDAAHALYPSNITSGRVLMFTTAQGVTNAGGSGVFPINADGSLSTAAQVQSLFPSAIVTNNDTLGFTNTGNIQAATFNGNGNGLTNLNAAQLVGVVPLVNVTNAGGFRVAFLNDTNGLGGGSTTITNYNGATLATVTGGSGSFGVSTNPVLTTATITNLYINGITNVYGFFNANGQLVGTNSGIGLTNLSVTSLNGGGGSGSAATNGVLGQVAISAGNGGIFWSNFVGSGGGGTGSSNLFDSGYTVLVRSNLTLTNTTGVSTIAIGTTSPNGATNALEQYSGTVKQAWLGTNGIWYGNALGLTNSINLIPGSNVTITTNADGRTWTIAASGSGGGIATVQTNTVTLGTSQTTLNLVAGANTTVTGNVAGATSIIGIGVTANVTTNNGTLSGLQKGDGGRGTTAAAFTDVQSLAPSAIHTNNMSIAASFSNNVAIDAAHILSLSNITTGRLLTYTTAQGLTNIGVSSGIVDATGAQATSAQVQNLFPGTIHTNNASTVSTFSNNVGIDAAHELFLTNTTGGKVMVYTTSGGVTNSGLGAVPINGDTTATTAAQIQALFPSAIITNGTTIGYTNTGNIQAATFNGNGNGLTNLNAAQLVGVVPLVNLTNASGSRIAFLNDTNGLGGGGGNYVATSSGRATNLVVSGTNLTYGANTYASTDGNLRGTNSIDLQGSRTTASQVARSDFSFIGGGSANMAGWTFADAYDVICGGRSNVTFGNGCFIGGGSGNTNDGYFNSVIVGGANNYITGLPLNCSILGGQFNIMNGADYSNIGGGYSNWVGPGYALSMGGGQFNALQCTIPYSSFTFSSGSTIPGGMSNYVAADRGFAIGSYLTNTTLDTIDLGPSNSVKTTFSMSGVQFRSPVSGNFSGATNIPVTAMQGSGGAGTAATNGTAAQVWTSAGNGGGYWNTLSGGGNMVGANNLSDISNAGAGRTNIGANVASNLTSGYVQNFVLAPTNGALDDYVLVTHISGGTNEWESITGTSGSPFVVATNAIVNGLTLAGYITNAPGGYQVGGEAYTNFATTAWQTETNAVVSGGTNGFTGYTLDGTVGSLAITNGVYGKLALGTANAIGASNSVEAWFGTAPILAVHTNGNVTVTNLIVTGSITNNNGAHDGAEVVLDVNGRFTFQDPAAVRHRVHQIYASAGTTTPQVAGGVAPTVMATAVALTPTATDGGSLLLNTSSSATTYTGLTNVAVAHNILLTNSFYFDAIAAVTNTTFGHYFIGVSAGTVTNIVGSQALTTNTYLGFRFSTNSANWYAVGCNGTSETEQASSVAADTGWHSFDIWCSDAYGTNYVLSIDGVKIATNSILAPSSAVSPMVAVRSTTANTTGIKFKSLYAESKW